MIEHIGSCCTYPSQCAFLEYECTYCSIPEKSGHTGDEDRNYADENGRDAWRPCKYYIDWDDALKLLIKAIEDRSGHE